MKLLVVEDDRLLNNTLCYNLSASDYAVDAAMAKAAALGGILLNAERKNILDNAVKYTPESGTISIFLPRR